MSDDEAPRKKSGYRLEYASSARAKCKGSKPCNGTPIPKGALRFGSLVDFRGSTSFSWRHWGCVTSKIISNMKKSFDEADKLDGFGELREEDQDKIRKAWDAGHVADADIPETARSREPDEDEHTDNRKKQDNKGKAVKRAKDDDKADEPQQKKARKMKNEECDEELSQDSSSSSTSVLDKILSSHEVGSPGPSTSLQSNGLELQEGMPISESNASSRSSTGTTLACRLCSSGAKQPTVTTCGHLFCHDCIIGELSKNLRCPVCQAIMLVHLQMD